MDEENTYTEEPREHPDEPEAVPGDAASDAAPGDSAERAPEQLDFASMETPEELLPRTEPAITVGDDAEDSASGADAGGEADAEGETAPADEIESQLVPALDRERPAREPLVSRVWWVLGALLLAALVVGGIALYMVNAESRTVVPNVVGRSVGEAQATIAHAGLTSRVVENRFSTEPIGRVLEQLPGAGVETSRGEVVELVVSAGTEEMVMPDVIGDGLSLARGILEARGLVIEVEYIASEDASDTVLATIPSPGSIVRTGDVIHVQVAAPISGSATLRPFNLQGLTFVIDPALSPAGATSDTSMEVSRRLRSLLEASGATVHVLRSGLVTSTPDAERAQNARAINAVAGIGLSVAATGQEGRTVSLVANTGAPRPSLSSVVANQLSSSVPPSIESSSVTDPVLSGTTYPSVRIGLGVLTSQSDVAAFGDPRWADRVAQAIYTALGEAFGERQQP